MSRPDWLDEMTRACDNLQTSCGRECEVEGMRIGYCQKCYDAARWWAASLLRVDGCAADALADAGGEE